MEPFEIRLVSSDFIESRWDEISQLLTASFSDSDLFSGFTPERPAQHTWEEMHKPGGSELGHVVAIDGKERVLGAALCLPMIRPENETSCDLGWFFTDQSLPGSEGTKVADAIAERSHEELVACGYDTIVTEMGTEAGARYLGRKYGYVPAPLGEKENRWIKSLVKPTEDNLARNSAKMTWKSVDGQTARYATTDIAKDDVIIDLKLLLKRVTHPSVKTLQLEEDYHYESSAGPLGMSHHCSPNGYICFDDLTYRALRDIAEGDELTFHYCTTEFELANPFDCVCGSPDCLGRVRGFKYLNGKDVERITSLLSPFLRSKL